jgi:adenylate cyclase
MARLLVKKPDGQEAVHALESSTVTIGREGSDIVFDGDPFVSRRHATIVRQERDYWLRDENSRNGTFVNRMRIREKQLVEGDEIVIGKHTLVFEERLARDVLDLTEDSTPRAQGTVIRPVAEDRSVHTMDCRYAALTEMSERLNTIVDRKELLEEVMDGIFYTVHPERAYFFLVKRGESDPVPVASRCASSVSEQTPVSRTIVNKAIQQRSALLTQDARSEFALVDSVGESRSVICVPLVTTRESYGALYVDDSREVGRFTEEDLDLMIAVGNQVSLALERTRLYEEWRREALVRNHLQRFVAPGVADIVAQQTRETGQLCLDVHEREVTILFSDIQDFTAMARTMSPFAVAELLNEYFTEMTDVIFAFEGTLDKYMGDGIMAIFGAPIACADHAERAVLAALAMLDRHKQLMASKSPDKRFAMRIGVNTGMAVVGFIGTVTRLEYTAVGDTVNVASRLEAAAGPDQVWVGGTTLNRIVTEQKAEDGHLRIRIGEERLKVVGREWLLTEFKGKRVVKNIEIEAYQLLCGGEPGRPSPASVEAIARL